MNAIIFEHLYYKLTIKDIIVLPILIHFLIIYNIIVYLSLDSPGYSTFTSK